MTSAEPLSDGVLFLHFIAGMLLVLALLGAFGFALRHASLKGWLPGSLRSRTAGHLQLCEALALDARQRLVLVRCDETAYLLLLAPDHSLVIASMPWTKDSSPLPASPSAPDPASSV